MKSGVYYGGTNMAMIEVRMLKGLGIVLYVYKKKLQLHFTPTNKLIKQLKKFQFQYLGKV